MRALLLAAGLGTRLRPLTNELPKCLVPIKGQPLLGIWLERLTYAGIGPFLINTHYLTEKVEAYMASSPYRHQVNLVNETELLGTAGTLIENLHFFDNEDGMLIHADNYCMADFKAFQEAHSRRPKECLLTMMTFRTLDPLSCGVVELNKRGVVTGFHEKVDRPISDLANGAVYILSKELLSILQTEFTNATDFSTEVVGKLVGRVYSYETSELFLDIGTTKGYEKANI